MAIVQTGKFVSDGNAKTLRIRSGIQHIATLNATQMATTQTTGRGVKFEWFEGMAQGSAVEYKKTNSTDVLNGVVVTSGGFTIVDSSDEPVGPEKTGTAITAANPAVVTMNSHGFNVGDVVRLYGTTGMLQIAGMEFTITAVADANTFTLGYLDASGFTAAATAVKARKIKYGSGFAPRRSFVTSISKASQAVVKLSSAHDYIVGQYIRMNVPEAYGMSEMNGLMAKIVGVSGANNTITLDVDSSGFTTFAFPSSANYLTSFAAIIPVGEVATELEAAEVNDGYVGITLEAGAQSPAGSSGDVIYWIATSADQTQDE